jgi:hypothetical protein
VPTGRSESTNLGGLLAREYRTDFRHGPLGLVDVFKLSTLG